MTYILRRFPDASSCLLLCVMKTCTAILVSVELQAPSFFRLDDVCVHEACSVENATVVGIRLKMQLFVVEMQQKNRI